MHNSCFKTIGTVRISYPKVGPLKEDILKVGRLLADCYVDNDGPISDIYRIFGAIFSMASIFYKECGNLFLLRLVVDQRGPSPSFSCYFKEEAFPIVSPCCDGTIYFSIDMSSHIIVVHRLWPMAIRKKIGRTNTTLLLKKADGLNQPSAF